MTLTHIPVLLAEVMAALDPKPGETVIDATLGLGGHATHILDQLGPTGHVLGLERSAEGLAEATERLAAYRDQVTLVRADFRDLGKVAKQTGMTQVQAILFDLGLASWQIDTGYQGLSFQRDEVLDMRLGPYRPNDFTRKEDDPSGWIQAGDTTLARTVRTWRFQPASAFLAEGSEEELSNVFRTLGDVSSPRAMARRIIDARSRSQIERTSQLVAALGTKDPSRLAPLFQALRILVNDEYGALVAGLHDAWQLLGPGGRLVVISFHSGEDRIVKRFMKSLTDAKLTDPIKPAVTEIKANPRSRSAILRTAHKQSSTTNS